MLSCAMVGRHRQRGEPPGLHPDQRCVFHAYSAVKRKTTTGHALRRVLISTVLLRPCSRSLPLIQAVAWIEQTRHLEHHLQGIPSQRTRLPDGRWVATRMPSIRGKNSLNTLVKQGTLFTYLDPALDLEGDPIARTSNLIEGGINTTRCVLRIHRGMSLNHQVKTNCCGGATTHEFPATPSTHRHHAHRPTDH